MKGQRHPEILAMLWDKTADSWALYARRNQALADEQRNIAGAEGHAATFEKQAEECRVRSVLARAKARNFRGEAA